MAASFQNATPHIHVNYSHFIRLDPGACILYLAIALDFYSGRKHPVVLDTYDVLAGGSSAQL